MATNDMLNVEVAYAKPNEQRIISVKIMAGSTIEMAIHCSGILTLFPEIDLERQKVGVFSKPRALSDIIKEGDRIEIYRSLVIDPKTARRVKAKSKLKR